MAAKPEKTIRIGSISASIFANTREAGDEEKTRTIRSVTLQRSYKDDEGNWRNTASFGLADLPTALRVLELAQAHVERAELVSESRAAKAHATEAEIPY